MHSRDRSRLTRCLAVLVTVLVLLSSGLAGSEDPGQATVPVERIAAVLEARAESPEATRWPTTATRGSGPSRQRFFLTGPDNAPSVRAFPDVTGDGFAEIAVGIDESGTDNVFLLDGRSSGAATTVWAIETTDGVSGGSPYSELALEPASDADGNGIPNLLLGTAWGGRTAYGLDGLDGTIHWRLDTYNEPDSGWVYAVVEVGDVTGDGVPEAAFAVGSDNNGVYLVDGASIGGGAATVIWRFPAADGVLAVCNAGDLDGDGAADVLAAVGDSGEELVALASDSPSPSGTVLWRYPAGVTVFACATLPDQSGDGRAEAVAVVWASDGSSVRVLDGATGTMVWSSTEVVGPGMMVDRLADITGDGVPELIASSWENAVTVLDGKTGARVWKTPLGGDVWTARSIADLDGDGIDDVIAGSFDHGVYALAGDDGAILWSFDTGNRVFSVAPVPDLSGDGRSEVAVGTQDTTNNDVFRLLDGAVRVPLFADGFELGDLSAWSLTVP